MLYSWLLKMYLKIKPIKSQNPKTVFTKHYMNVDIQRISLVAVKCRRSLGLLYRDDWDCKHGFSSVLSILHDTSDIQFNIVPKISAWYDFSVDYNFFQFLNLGGWGREEGAKLCWFLQVFLWRSPFYLLSLQLIWQVRKQSKSLGSQLGRKRCSPLL